MSLRVPETAPSAAVEDQNEPQPDEFSGFQFRRFHLWLFTSGQVATKKNGCRTFRVAV